MKRSQKSKTQRQATSPEPKEEAFTTIPCIREKTMEDLRSIMVEEKIWSFDDMIAHLMWEWDLNKWSRDPRARIREYLADPGQLIDPQQREIFEALKRLYPKEYREEGQALVQAELNLPVTDHPHT